VYETEIRQSRESPSCRLVERALVHRRRSHAHKV
jgi:hypothetical protein